MDDHFAMHRSLVFLHDLEQELQEVFWNKIHVEIHPHKIKYSYANASNMYLGAYVRPNYIVPRQRTIDKFVRVAQEMEYQLIFSRPTLDDLELIRSRINSNFA